MKDRITQVTGQLDDKSQTLIIWLKIEKQHQSCNNTESIIIKT